MKWAIVTGTFETGGKGLKFHGGPAVLPMADGSTRGLAVGRAICSERFSEGDIRAQIEFTQITPANACEIILYFEPSSGAHISAGIGGVNSAFVIRQFNGQWTVHASSGDRNNLKPKHKYDVRVALRGSRVALFIDDVEVCGATLPIPIPPTQVGVFCIDDQPIHISNFEVTSQRGRVFVVMQFESNFKDIYEDVVKRVCAEFGLEARRADETYGPGVVIADMVRDIAESEFVVVDITHPNPNVYYELGYAHAIRKPAILLADRRLDKLPLTSLRSECCFMKIPWLGKASSSRGCVSTSRLFAVRMR